MKYGRILTVLGAGLFAIALMVVPARASTASFADNCSAPPDLGTNPPVILIHGFTGKPSDFGDPDTAGTMFHAIKQVPNLYVETFDWSGTNTSWVTNPDNGPRLAARIDCLAQASIENGGLGKVILVAHSMGGLMVRYAASFSLHGRLLSNEIGLVVTLGTPNLGSAWATWTDPLVATVCAAADGSNPWRDANTSYCPDYTALTGLVQDSQLINNLPWLPPGIPVRAIAGDVSLRVQLLNSTATNDTHGDLLVGVDSALAAKHATVPLYEGAGDSVFHCAVEIGKPLPCGHVGLLSNPAVQQKVTDSIRAYLLNGGWEPFVTGFGKWHVHTTQLRIEPEGQSPLSWNAGPCVGSSGVPTMCTGHVYLRFHPFAGALIGTVTNGSVWYTTWSGDSVPQVFTPQDGAPQPGQTIKLVPTKYPHVLKMVHTHDSPGMFIGGNPHFCQDGAPQWLVLNGTCGA